MPLSNSVLVVRKLPLAFPIPDKRYQRRGYAEFFGDALPGVALREKASDFINVIIGKFYTWVDAARGSQLLKGWVPVNAKAMSEGQPAKHRGNGAQRKLEALGDGGTGFSIHPGPQNVIHHIIGYDSIRVGPSTLWRCPQRLKGRVSVVAELVAPSLTRAHIFDDVFGDIQGIGDLAARKAIKPHPVNLSDSRFVDFGIGPQSPAAFKSVVGVVLRASPSKMLGVATRWVVAAMQGHKARFARIALGERERMPVGTNVFPVMPKDAIAPLVAVAFPVPALIVAAPVNFVPESIFIFHNRRTTMTALTHQGVN